MSAINIKNWIILLVDDTPDNITVVQTALKFHGAEVYTATNGEEGLAMLETIQPTVILLDIRMPKMDGWSMFKSIRENPVMAHIPIIAVTAYAMDSDKDDILDGGFDGYISKPFDILNLVQEVQAVVHKKRTAQQG